MSDVRKGQAPGNLERDAFHERVMDSYRDPAFQEEAAALARIVVIAWEAYQAGRKSPSTRKAGPDFADPDYDSPSNGWRPETASPRRRKLGISRTHLRASC